MTKFEFELVKGGPLTAESNSMVHDIINTEPKNIFRKFIEKKTNYLTGYFEVGDREATVTQVEMDVGRKRYRIDLQKYNNNGAANFNLQSGKTSYAALFVPPNEEIPGDLIEEAFTESLKNKNGMTASIFKVY
jgi:hypothetical protein